ncbi:MAG TPA: site-specific integrase [Stellaceae bacterium]|nr:site-specific integrase [Stellaceae bacterium]
MPAILPDPAARGAEKFTVPLPAGASPEDVRHWFDLETIAELPAPVASFGDAADAAAQYRRASRAENTRRAYRAGVARFTEWCATHGQVALPASPETVAAFLAAEARAELAVNTLRLRHAAIRYMHLLAGCPPPTAAAVVTTTFAGIKRAHRRRLNKKTALVVDRLRAALQAIPETLPGSRDRALLLVGFAAALRPSEIARLTFELTTHHADGIELFLPWRKNDQDARDTKLWLPKGRTDLCPVTALEAWLALAAISGGPLFRRIWRLPPPRVPRGTRRKPVADRYRIGTSPIDTDSIALIVKNWTGLAGFDAAGFAGHSLRRGAISSGVAPGRPHRPPQAVLRPRVPEEPRGIRRARRVAAQSSAEGHTLDLPVRTAPIGRATCEGSVSAVDR